MNVNILLMFGNVIFYDSKYTMNSSSIVSSVNLYSKISFSEIIGPDLFNVPHPKTIYLSYRSVL